MRNRVRVPMIALASASLLLTVSPVLAAAAPSGHWVSQGRVSFVKVFGFSPGTVAGHQGNWHSFNVDVDQDDDGINGGLIDWFCPAGKNPSANTGECTVLALFDLNEAPGVVFTVSPTLTRASITGPTSLDGDDGSALAATMNIRLRATGTLTTTVDVSQPEGLPPIKRVDRARDGVEVRGRFGYVSTAAPGAFAYATAITQYELFDRV